MRYIGNKNKLISEIDRLLIEKNIKNEGLVFCDLFSGTATVAGYYNGFYKILANDIMDYAYYYSAGLLLNSKREFPDLGFDPFVYFNNCEFSSYKDGFCYNHFSPNGNRQYFSDENAMLIDFIRDTIDIWYSEKKISNEEKAYLICCLLEAVSKVSNVAGVYSAYLKIWDPRAVKKMHFVPVEIKSTTYANEVYCADANDIIDKLEGDILYIDPPYTPTQYCSQYHVLETIARNDSPETHGIGAHRKNDRLSNWCKKGKAEFEFEQLIANSKFKHIVFSYSDKGIMSAKFIEAVLKRYGKVDTYVFKKISFVKYKNTRAVNRENLLETKNEIHYEYLFYIEKKENINFISPLNYIGGKFEALPLIKQNLPKSMENCFDLFGGGGTVSVNLIGSKIVYNDINSFVVSLLKYLAKTNPFDVYQNIQKYIKKFGLEKANKDAYYKLRNEYNNTKQDCLLYLLICYGFEHQIRFNTNHEFNNPCGNSGFNDEMYEKIISYYLICNELNIEFNSKDYKEFVKDIAKNDFVYLDPPYLNNLGVYNDGKRGFNGWDKDQELELYKTIEGLNFSGAKFMLSNFTEHDENQNNELIDWATAHKFKVVLDDKITKRNRQNRRELIIINY